MKTLLNNIILFSCLLVFVYPIVISRPSEGYPVVIKEGEVPPPLVLPYQKCGDPANSRTKNWIENLHWPVEETEAEFCFECQQNGQASFSTQAMAYQIQKASDSISLPKECFLAMSVKGNRNFKRNQYINCHKGVAQTHRKLCVTPEYVETFREVFLQMSKCFSYSHKRQQQVLHLINQESGGIANILSPSTAKCFGQITEGFVDTINNQINARSRTALATRHLKDIYDEVVQKCPNLKEKKLKGNSSLVCKSTQDPYACLFYAFLGLDRNMRLIKDNFYKVEDNMGNRDFDTPEKEKLREVFPLTVSEMARVKVSINGEEKEWLIWDDVELYDQITGKRKKGIDITLLSVEKIPLFKHEQDVQLFFNYWGHNGGGSLAGSRLISMLEKLKKDLSSSSSCKPDAEAPLCKARATLMKGQSLSNKAAVSLFEQDLSANYPADSQDRRTEVSQYVRKIINGSQSTFDYKPESAGTNSMLKHYQGAFQFGEINLSDDNAHNFQKHVANVCPDMTDIIQWE